MVKYNRKGNKILIPIKVYDEETEDYIESYRYVYSSGKKKNTINKKKRKLARKYGFEDVNEFWEEIKNLAEEDGYNSVWKFINDGKIDDYYQEGNKRKRQKTESNSIIL